MAEQKMLTVEQCDREAAAAYISTAFGERYRASVLNERIWPDLVQAFARHRLAATKAADERARVMEERAAFLLDRLAEIEWHDDGYEAVHRDYFGHVEPAIEGLRAALAEAGSRDE